MIVTRARHAPVSEAVTRASLGGSDTGQGRQPARHIPQVVALALSRRVDVRGIGLPGGDFTELGVRYRWASE